MKGMMAQLVESAVIAAALGLFLAALVNFSEGVLVHAVFWGVLGVGALVVYLILRIERVIDWQQACDRDLERDLDRITNTVESDPHYNDLGSQDWGDIKWIGRD